MFKSGVGGSPFAERNFHPHTTRRFNRRTKEKSCLHAGISSKELLVPD
jgi:hypothetical protein